MKTIKIICENNQQTYKIELGSSLEELKKKIYPEENFQFLGALVNHQLQDLQYIIMTPIRVKFLEYTSLEGYAIYCRSLIFLLYRSILGLYPFYKLRAEYLISNGLYCKITHPKITPTIDMIAALKAKMQEMVKSNLSIIREEITTEKACRLLEKRGLRDKSNLLTDRGKFYSSLYYLDQIPDYFYGTLAPSTGYLHTFDLIPYKEGMLLVLPDRIHPHQLQPVIPQEKLYRTLYENKKWGKILEITDMHHLNKIVDAKYAEPMIQISEALHEKKIAEIADEIKKRRKQIKVILIAGPSSSGKTTFGKRLAIQLLVNCIKPINLSLDNYFVNRECTPRDEKGEYDYETIEALDIATFNDNLQRLLQGEEVELPKFSFETGKRYYDGRKVKLQKNNVIIVEGIHGLNPKLTHLLPPNCLFKIFISALTSISIDSHNIIIPSDNRLIRRMVRDYKYRHNTALDTLKRWESVLLGEKKHIVPYQEEADAIFNSALIYELGALKTQAVPLLREISQQHPEHSKALELLKFFSYIRTVPTESIPPTSILREFLGGSSFNY